MLCYRAPYPLRSGSEIRMYQFIEMLSEVYDIDLFYLREHEEQDAEMAPLYEKCHSVEKFRVPVPVRCLQTGIGYVFRGWPLQLGYFYSAAMYRRIKEVISGYDKVLCMHIRMMSYLMKLPTKVREGLHIYFDGIDAISMNYRNAYETSGGIKKLINGMEYRRMETYEAKVYESVEKSILISERDRDYITKTLGVKCNPAVIYNYAIDHGYEKGVTKEKRTVAFMGKMNYAPNVDAVLWFAKEIFPALKAEYPDFEFQIIGGNATKEVQALGQTDGISLLGFVDKPAGYLQAATLVIAPMISGSGLQNKIVQAMYLGAPVLTTPIGAQGLFDVSQKELIIADGPEDMIRKLKKYLGDDAKEERELIGSCARAYIEKYYSYEGVKKQVLDFFGADKV